MKLSKMAEGEGGGFGANFGAMLRIPVDGSEWCDLARLCDVWPRCAARGYAIDMMARACRWSAATRLFDLASLTSTVWAFRLL
mmetsp:Transcript_52509/g.137596  ORF Transcript_52509/g.137596 Transcript_52509/m.137596 type:complete len:83 (-) Transcript_52509:3597-3845(-)